MTRINDFDYRKYEQDEIKVTRRMRRKYVTEMGGNTWLGRTSHRITQLLFIIVFFVALLIAIVTIHNYSPVEDPIGSLGWLDRLSLFLGAHDESAIAVIDLGLSASTVFLYIFQRHNYDGTFHIGKELKELVQPGIFDSYYKNDFEIDASVRELVSQAVDMIPPRFIKSHPPLIVAKINADAFNKTSVEKVRKSMLFLGNHLKASPFLYDPEKNVGFFQGNEETILNWVAINLATHAFQKQDLLQSAATVDVGQNDLRVIFATWHKQELPASIIERVDQINTFGRVIKVVTIKLPNLGLFKARLSILSRNTTSNGTEIHSECFNPMSEAHWSFNGENYSVFGKEEPDFELIKERNGPFAGKKIQRPVANVSECRKRAVDYIESALNSKELERLAAIFKTRKLFMEGLLLEKCMERGLTLPLRGGHIHKSSYESSMLHSCKVPNTEQPFACVDMIYLHTLLQKVLGFSKGSTLHSSKNVNELTAEWPLATAFHIYENGL